MIQLPELYPHQEDMRDSVRSSVAKHGRSILCAAPGTGKTRTAKWILGAAANRNRHDRISGFSLFTVQKRGLVDNAVNSFSEEPYLPHGVIMSGRQPMWGKRTQVASIDTLLSWFIEDDKYSLDYTFDLIVWDEAHSHHPKFARFLLRHDAKRLELGMPPAYVVGLTATPEADGLADVYKEIVLGPSTSWLIEHNYLSPFRYFRATEGQLDKLKKRGGEYTNSSVAEAMDGLAGDLARDWKQLAEGRPTVGFFPRRSHAQDAATLLTEAGLRVAYVDGETPDDERNRIFGQLNDHKIDYLCNVQVVERGTDIPRIGCVQMCVSVASRKRWLQMIGRGSRRHPEKTDCIVLDHGGNLKRGMPFFEDEVHWSLDVTTKDPGEATTRPTIECPNCSAIYRGGKCNSCNYEPTPKERKSQGLDFDGTELKEVTKKDRPTLKLKTPEELMVSSIYRAGKTGRTWRQCVGIFRSENKRQGTNYKIPKTVTIAGRKYYMPSFSSSDSGRRVESLYPVVNGSHGGDYLVEQQHPAVTF